MEHNVTQATGGEASKEDETMANQHVVPYGDQWAVRREGSDHVTSTHRTQADAIERGRQIAINQHSELFIHRPDGTIRERNSYGNDPASRPG